MSQPSLNDFLLPSEERVGGPVWPPVAQRAVGCGLSAAISVILAAFLLWGLLALWVKAATLLDSSNSPPSKTPARSAPAAKPAVGKPIPSPASR